jgi:peptidoglycan/LPS O-acetylase OafA/YrhL
MWFWGLLILVWFSCALFLVAYGVAVISAWHAGIVTPHDYPYPREWRAYLMTRTRYIELIRLPGWNWRRWRNNYGAAGGSIQIGIGELVVQRHYGDLKLWRGK